MLYPEGILVVIRKSDTYTPTTKYIFTITRTDYKRMLYNTRLDRHFIEIE